LLEEFRRKNYYGVEHLKSFCEHYETPAELASRGKRSNLSADPDFVINDADGYTNMRSGESIHSDVVIQIPHGASIDVIKINKEWWHVRYLKDTGYVHESRILRR